ncbi:C11orf80 isoform 8, partial [Pan troglodytes]
VYTLLTTHLNAILVESHSVVQGSIQFTVDKVLEQHHQAAKAQQKLQASLSVAVNSIMSILTGSTRSSFRKMCLQTLQAADTQEFGTKLHKVFREITQHQFLHHCSCEVKQLTLEKKDSAQGTEDAPDNSSLELLAVLKQPSQPTAAGVQQLSHSVTSRDARYQRASRKQEAQEGQPPHRGDAISALRQGPEPFRGRPAPPGGHRGPPHS